MIDLKYTDFAVSAEVTNQNRSDKILLQIVSLHSCKIAGGVHLTPSEAFDLGRELMKAATLAKKQGNR